MRTTISEKLKNIVLKYLDQKFKNETRLLYECMVLHAYNSQAINYLGLICERFKVYKKSLNIT